MIANKKILVLSFTYLDRDPRVNRQIRYLKDGYRVVCAGAGAPRIDGVDFVRIDRRPLSPAVEQRRRIHLIRRRYEDHYWQCPFVVDSLGKLENVGADLIVANDIDTLPLALRIADGAPVVFDAHEYSPLEFEDLLWFWALHRNYRQYLCREYLPRAARMITVCEGIAERYRTEFSVRPTVIHNAPLSDDLRPTVPDDKIRLIHHGGAMVSRRMELMVEMMRYLDSRFELYFMLVESNPPYMRRLERLARRFGRTEFLPPVEMPDIAKATNRFDIGLFLLPPVNFNYRHALPNKLFEFIQARLGVAVGPSPEMASIVKRHDLGVVADRFDPRLLARRLNELTRDDVLRFKWNAHAVARRYSHHVTRAQLLEIVDSLIGAGRSV